MKPLIKIEKYIKEHLNESSQKNALDFFAFLIENEMVFEKGKGYWEDKFYLMVKFKNEYICFVLINNSNETPPWIIWSDDSNSNWFASISLEEYIREIAWENVDICGNCGGCEDIGGSYKTIFGKDFNNVCRTTFKFINPDTKTLECVKKIVEFRKIDISQNKN